MKKLYFTLLLSLLAFVGCKEKTPGEVAVMLFNSITVGDADVVKQNIHFKEIDEYERCIVMTEGTKIPIEQVREIDGELFKCFE